MTDRTPYCHKIRYGITGAPIVTDDEMDGSHAPGVGIAPALIELVYSAPRDGKPASVSASVTGAWTRFGRREDDSKDDQVTTHFKSSPDGWPEWLAAEARLHDPAPPPVPADADLRTLIRGVIRDCPALYPDDIADRVWAALQSAYRRLLARLEADRARHLRAAAQTKEAGADEVLLTVSSTFASAFRHAAAMVVRAFEGPDAAQAYMQRTEGGEEVAGALADDEPEGDLATARDTNRRLNYEKQQLESELAAYRRAVGQWEVSERGTYISHASLRTIGLACGKDILGSVRHLKHFERVEQAEAEIERLRTGRAAVLREAADECDTAGAAYTARAQNEHAAGAFALMETFLRKADEAEYVATPCDFVGCEPGGEPCSTHQPVAAQADRVLDERVAAAKEQPVEAGPSCVPEHRVVNCPRCDAGSARQADAAGEA